MNKDDKLTNQQYKDICKLFENLPAITPVASISKRLGYSSKTFYNWHYGSKMRTDIPKGLFVKLKGRLYISKEVLIQWLTSMEQP